MARNDNTVVIEGARIVFRNFAGKEGKYNREGDRSFGVILPEQIAKQMLEDGWNVKYLQPREDEEEEVETPWLPVSANYGKGRPPRVVIITERGRTNLGEDEVEMIDWADITNVDLIVRPYNWDVNGNSGVKAYLQSIYVTIEEDELEKKYGELSQQ